MEKETTGAEKMENEKEQRFCPVCGSTKLEWLIGGVTGDQYKCECGYQGIALMGTSQTIKKIREQQTGVKCD